MTSAPLLIRPFQPSDQAACRDLILSGLVEHWGWLDPTLNPDLNDIQAAYADGLFLTAWQEAVTEDNDMNLPDWQGAVTEDNDVILPDWQEAELIGTGALLPAGPGCFQVVRMSVAKSRRGQGVGRRVLACLENYARAAGAGRLVLETTETWEGVILFYLTCGYRVTHQKDGDIYFEKELHPLK